MVASSAWIVIRLQVAIVYLHAAVGKLQVTEWANGTALYYWFLDPAFGAPAWLRPAVEAFVTTPLVAILTWSVLVLEFTLVLGLLAGRRTRFALLALGLSFHAGIIVVHGLVSFFLAMAAALVLYLVPSDAGWYPVARWKGSLDGTRVQEGWELRSANVWAPVPDGSAIDERVGLGGRP